MASKESKAWTHFEKIQGSSDVRCKICHQKKQRSGTSTRALWSHLESMHKAEYDLLRGDEQKKEPKEKVEFFYFHFKNENYRR